MPKDQRERRLSYGDFNKFSLPLNTRQSQWSVKTAFTSRRPSINETKEPALPVLSARLHQHQHQMQKHQNISVMDFGDDEIIESTDKQTNNNNGQDELKRLLTLLREQV